MVDDFEQRRQQAYANLGMMVGFLQSVEGMLRFVMIYVLQDAPPLDLERLLSQQNKTAKRTAGQFVVELRKRVSIHPGLDDMLEEFLELRNAVIHDHARIDGWDFDSEDGLRVVHRSIARLSVLTFELMKIFTALIMAWQKQTGIAPDLTPDNEFMQDIEKRYMPLVDELFREP